MACPAFSRFAALVTKPALARIAADLPDSDPVERRRGHGVAWAGTGHARRVESEEEFADDLDSLVKWASVRHSILG
jgi:hypothetical protein